MPFRRGRTMTISLSLCSSIAWRFALLRESAY